MFGKKLIIVLLAVYCLVLFTACNTDSNESKSSTVIPESSSSSEVQTASSNDETVLNSEIQSEEERYIELTKTLIDEGTKAICWWLDDIHNSFDIPLDNEPSYLDIYYPIPGYNSIEELKQATEQIFTNEFAEHYLYFVLTELEPPRFVEHEGKLYGNDNGGWGMMLGSIKDYEATSITESKVVVTVTADSYSGDEELTFDFILVKNGVEKDDRFDGWRLNTYFIYDGD